MKRFVTLVVCAALVSCFSPHTVTPRHFLLTSVTATDSRPAVNVRLGVRVRMSEYLLGNSIAVRDSANEIRYLDSVLWAERLDKGFERVLAADLSAMIPTSQVRLGAWRTDDVTLEVHVSVEQFDVDRAGKGNLVAGWRITSPGGRKMLDNGTARLTRSGKSDPQDTVTTMSELTAEFSRTLAQAMKEIPMKGEE